MKLLDQIEAKRGREVATHDQPSRFVKASVGNEAVLLDFPRRWRWRYQVRFWCDFLGTWQDEPHIKEKARQLIAKEVYGELSDDLLQLQSLLFRERYRDAADPILRHVEMMFKKTIGMRAEA